MKKVCQYVLMINRNPKTDPSFLEWTYSYGVYKNICIRTSLGGASVRFFLKTRLDPGVFLDSRIPENNSRLHFVMDALRKMLIVHLLHTGQSLEIQTIYTGVRYPDGKTFWRQWSREMPGCEDFPFLEGAAFPIRLSLSSSWKKSAIFHHLLGLPPSLAREDLKLSSLYSFFAARGRISEVDRFLSLWTSLNAFYLEIARQHDELLERMVLERLHLPMPLQVQGKRIFHLKEDWQNHPQETVRTFLRYVQGIDRIGNSDTKAINLLLRFFKAGKARPTQKEWLKEGKDRLTSRSVSACSSDDPFFYNINRQMACLNESQACQMYSLLRLHQQTKEATFLMEAFRTEPGQETRNSAKEADFSVIHHICQVFEISPFGLLLLVYPYMWRCSYVHGATSSMLYTFPQARENRILHSINTLLHCFLQEEIPRLFDEDYFTKEICLDLQSAALQQMIRPFDRQENCDE